MLTEIGKLMTVLVALATDATIRAEIKCVIADLATIFQAMNGSKPS